MKFKTEMQRRNLKNFVVRVGLEPVSNWEKGQHRALTD